MRKILVRLAERIGARLLLVQAALATHSRGGLARVVLGSILIGLVPRADTPILPVRPTAAASSG
jgi:hypothetical protein